MPRAEPKAYAKARRVAFGNPTGRLSIAARSAWSARASSQAEGIGECSDRRSRADAPVASEAVPRLARAEGALTRPERPEGDACGGTKRRLNE